MLTGDWLTTAVQNAMVSQKHDKVVPIDTFFQDRHYLGASCDPIRFTNQRRMLLAFYQQTDRLNDDDRDWLTQLKAEGKTNYEEGMDYRTLLLYSGQRWGKSYLLAGVSLYEAHKWLEMEDPHVEWMAQSGKPPIKKGAPIECKMASTAKEKVRDNEYAEAKSFVENSPYFADKFNIDKQSKAMVIELPKNLMIRCGSASGRSIRGGTGLCMGTAELAWYHQTSSTMGAQEIYDALENTLATLDGRMVIATSPSDVTSVAHLMLEKAKAGISERILFFHLNTFEADPSQLPSDPFYVEKRKTNPEDYMRDFMAIVSETTEPFIRWYDQYDKLYSLQVPGQLKPPPFPCSLEIEQEFHYSMLRHILSERYPVIRKANYCLSLDPADKNDSFAYSLFHVDKFNHHIDEDVVGRFLPQASVTGEVDTEEAGMWFMALCRKFNPVVRIDMFGWEGLRQKLKNAGVRLKEKNMDMNIANNAKEAIYMDGPEPDDTGARAKNIETGQHVRMWMNHHLDLEMKGLKKEKERKIEYDRKPGQPGHGDMAISVLHCLDQLHDPKKHGPKLRSIQLGIDEADSQGGIRSW